MTTNDLFSMCSEDDAVDLGTVYSPSPKTLRIFGASFMQDRETIGSLKILDPKGDTIAVFDVWQSRWIEVADANA